MALRKTTISVRLTKAEADAFKKKAKQTSKSVSEYLRDIAVNSIQDALEKISIDMPIEVSKHVRKEMEEQARKREFADAKLLSDLRTLLSLHT